MLHLSKPVLWGSSRGLRVPISSAIPGAHALAAPRAGAPELGLHARDPLAGRPRPPPRP